MRDQDEIKAPPQAPAILQQQPPAALLPPGSAASIRPGGHVKEDLVKLMMIQNAQMQQVIMSHMTVSALGSFYGCRTGSNQAPRDLPLDEEDEADALPVYHHYYLQPPCPGAPLHPSALYLPDPSAASFSQPPADRPAGPLPPPPPPPPSAPSITPSAGNNDEAEKKRK